MQVKLGFKNFFGSIKKSFQFDVEDLFGLVALGMIFKGLYMWKPFMAWIVDGFLLFIMSVFAAKK